MLRDLAFLGVVALTTAITFPIAGTYLSATNTALASFAAGLTLGLLTLIAISLAPQLRAGAASRRQSTHDRHLA